MLRLTGHVSTANRGRLIQARAKLCQPLPDTAQGLILEVQGNAQSYYVHLRTKLTDLSRQLYQAKFETSEAWQAVRFRSSHLGHPVGFCAPHSRFQTSAVSPPLLLGETTTRTCPSAPIGSNDLRPTLPK